MRNISSEGINVVNEALKTSIIGVHVWRSRKLIKRYQQKYSSENPWSKTGCYSSIKLAMGEGKTKVKSKVLIIMTIWLTSKAPSVRETKFSKIAPAIQVMALTN